MPGLVDTSVWVDHLRQGDARLVALLEEGRVLIHPMVIGELACGRLERRRSLLGWLADLPAATAATHDEVMTLIERHELADRGIGYVDAHLLASARLSGPARLWTRDQKLRSVAKTVGVEG